MPIKEFKSKIFPWLNEPKWLNRLTLYFVLGAVIITALHVVFSYSGSLHTDVDSARYMLSALVQSEAAIVALVVTLSLVAVQLAASSYSARVIEVFRRTPDLWILMGIYGVAIFYGLGVLKMIENPLVGRQSNLEAQVSFAYYLGVFAFVALVPYIWNTLEMLKPSTVINMLAEGITKESILSANESDRWGEINVEKDPTQPIIDIVRIALVKYDIETIRDGLGDVRKHAEYILRNENIEKNEKEKISQHLFVHLLRFGELSASKYDDESTWIAIDNMTKIGIVTVEQKLKGAASFAAISLMRVGSSAAKNKLEGATIRVAKSFGEIGKTAVEQKLEIVATEALSFLNLIGEVAAKQKLKVATEKIVISIIRIGKVLTEHKLIYEIPDVILSLKEIGKVAAETDHIKAADVAQQAAEVFERIGGSGMVKLEDANYTEAYLKKIDELLSRLDVMMNLKNV
ncbi:MAG: DUF2254 domain-containing protein [Candidatus Methanoperedens sp.]|nr:DUF2254 domain-containing protein [Candidatus Methanoperedens sp.]